MKSYSFGWGNIPAANSLWAEYFSLRKAEFVDNKQWDLPHTDEAEFDCYDTPFAKFIIIEEDGHCVGGARLLSTNAPNYGGYTYMLNDALEKRITGIPRGLLPSSLPRKDTSFEATRFFVRRDLGFRKTLEVQRAIVQEVCDEVARQGGDEVYALMPVAVYKIFRKFGFQVEEHPEADKIDGILHSVGKLKIS